MKVIGGQTIGRGGYNSDLWMCSITIYSLVIVVNSIKIVMHVRYWTKLLLFAIVGTSLAPYLIYVWISNYALNRFVQNTPLMCFQNILTYCLTIFFSCLLIAFLSTMLKMLFDCQPLIKKLLFRMNNLGSEGDKR